jgi:hypothetical protein
LPDFGRYGQSISWPPSVDALQTGIHSLNGVFQVSKDFLGLFTGIQHVLKLFFFGCRPAGARSRRRLLAFHVRASVSESVPPHLHQTCQAILAVQNVEECPHDLTPLLSHGWSVGAVCFWVSSRAGKMVSWVPGLFHSHALRNGFTGSRSRVGGRSILRPRCRSTPIKGKPRPGGRLQDGARTSQ